jgi:zinc and cadmium transporter
VASVALAGAVLLIREERRQRLTEFGIYYATGTLLGAAFLGLLPHALHHMSPPRVLAATLAGLLLFFILEKLTIWRHCHVRHCDVHASAGALILVGDSLHNFADGVAIAAAFAGSVPLGIATSVAVLAHEVPQELGDFFILLESGYSKSRAFVFNMASGLFCVLGGLLGYVLASHLEAYLPYLVAVSAASFIYIALADLVPRHRQAMGMGSVVRQVVLIVAGIGTIIILHGH